MIEIEYRRIGTHPKVSLKASRPHSVSNSGFFESSPESIAKTASDGTELMHHRACCRHESECFLGQQRLESRSHADDSHLL